MANRSLKPNVYNAMLYLHYRSTHEQCPTPRVNAIVRDLTLSQRTYATDTTLFRQRI